MEDKTTITLTSSDGASFEVSREVAMKSETVAHMLNDIDDVENQQVPLPNVEGSVLTKVIEYCKFHVEAETKDEEDKNKKSDEEIKDFDNNFMKVDQSTLYDLILASNYLNISPLLDLCCQTVANMIKGKSPQEIRDLFGIENDFTPEEEEEVRRENQWAFD